ncbi:hypothetical protein AMJ82_08905 [candidate division TA06 bacterium SM23_40]|uniref:Uncharacterized protein n=1 Tax=candidate division TA06 bacterium SM23_40 TaxID=1703774 RepID=A0A0S8G7P4_UNCT6|nr:MAG: hypothetical protein AMJ82_08905 [candidate division TA06 bacterium SM23_40]
MRPNKKKIGCCTLCGKEVFEILSRYPQDHPLAGEPRKLGKPLESARRVDLVLIGGSTASVTVCSSCEVSDKTLPRLWKICSDASGQEITEPDRRAAKGIRQLKEEQYHAVVASAIRIAADLPISILSNSSWKEIYDIAARTG